jgi:hypothetical protein
MARFSVYHVGRGNEPVMVVGSVIVSVVLGIVLWGALGLGSGMIRRANVGYSVTLWEI